MLKRWAGETATALFVHVDESLQGMDVIRAFGAVGYFVQENVHLLNTHHLVRHAFTRLQHQLFCC